MSKWYGSVGYSITQETKPGVWKPTNVERKYYGDCIKKSSRWENSGNVNDNLTFNMEISILADPFAYQHFSELKYVEFMGSKWKITSVSVDRPRITLSIGGVYNG